MWMWHRLVSMDYLHARRLWRVARLIGWNMLLTIVGLALIGAAGEAYFRLTRPFMNPERPVRFVPGVGTLWQPNAAIRWTNGTDFWTVTYSNSLGFLDREPIAPEQAAAGCHISIIGDSFVDAQEVSIDDKVQVQLEKLAEQRWPRQDITASAFGYSNTGQFNQLPFYEQYARKLYPNLVVLVFGPNDFRDNSPHLKMIWHGLAPGSHPHLSATLRDDGSLELHPPDPDYRQFIVPSPVPLDVPILNRISRFSWFATRLESWHENLFSESTYKRRIIRNLEALRQRLDYPKDLLAGLEPRPLRFRQVYDEEFTRENPAPIYQEAITITGLALREFKARTERDGAALVILALYHMGGRDSARFAVLNDLAAAQRIPVISQYDYILRQGREIREGHWPNDAHWNEQGHQWAAEAVLEWLKQNPQVCAARTAQ